jgi:hypothetical protein
MQLSSVKTCQYQGWWDRRALRASAKGSRHTEDSAVHLPLPAFPPPLDFDPSRFALPPAYDEVVDLEKAVYPDRPRSKDFSDSSTLDLTLVSQKHFREWTKIERDSFHLPIRRHIRVFRCLRYTIFNVYRRLFTFVFVINVVGGFILLRTYRSPSTEGGQICATLATLASSNFLLAIIIRQDYLVNVLFRVAWLVPWSFSPSIRNIVARVYCYGGIHSGAAVAGTLWWLTFTAMTSLQSPHSTSSIVLTILTSTLLLAILILSYPNLRTRHHNTFELTHRFLGWTCIALFWTQFLLSTPSPLSSPTFYILSLTCILIIYPWLRLRRWTFSISPLSNHAILLSFPHTIPRFSCLSVSTSPLREWHPFATFPSPATQGGSMIISNAGDWTRRFIHTAHLSSARQTTLWTRPHPKAGVLSLSLLFPRVLIVTTGSGIGPALSSLLERPREQFARLVWVTKAPVKTYGAGIMDAVQRADGEAVVLDTDRVGRPGLLEMAWYEARREEVDAVFVLSNRKVVKAVVGGLERRGIRAYGPIWDS